VEGCLQRGANLPFCVELWQVVSSEGLDELLQHREGLGAGFITQHVDVAAHPGHVTHRQAQHAVLHVRQDHLWGNTVINVSTECLN